MILGPVSYEDTRCKSISHLVSSYEDALMFQARYNMK